MQTQLGLASQPLGHPPCSTLCQGRRAWLPFWPLGALFWADTESGSEQPWLVTLTFFKKRLFSTILAFSAWNAEMPTFWVPLISREKSTRCLWEGGEAPRFEVQLKSADKAVLLQAKAQVGPLMRSPPSALAANSTSAPDILACKYSRSTPPNPDAFVSWTLYTLLEITEVWKRKLDNHCGTHEPVTWNILCTSKVWVLPSREPEYQLLPFCWPTAPSSEVICKALIFAFTLVPVKGLWMWKSSLAQWPDAALFLLPDLLKFQSSFHTLHFQ